MVREAKVRNFHQAKWDEPVIFELSNILHAYMGYEGIEHFYTVEGFDVNARSILGRINYSRSLPRSPMIMYQEGRVDCDSLSNAIMCLSYKYNVTCKFFHELKFDDSYPGPSDKIRDSYLGIKCWNHTQEYWNV